MTENPIESLEHKLKTITTAELESVIAKAIETATKSRIKITIHDIDYGNQVEPAKMRIILENLA